jgi:putative flippase GtrA
MRYAAVGFTGALVNVGACVFLVERRGWSAGLALAAAIELALLSNFLWNKVLTFRRAPKRFGKSSGVLARLLRYERVCAPGAFLNASLTFVLYGRGVALAIASAAGVMLGGAWNLFFNVPAIWRTWGLHSYSSRSGVSVPASVRPARSVRL